VLYYRNSPNRLKEVATVVLLKYPVCGCRTISFNQKKRSQSTTEIPSMDGFHPTATEIFLGQRYFSRSLPSVEVSPALPGKSILIP
jgi:hypothetical protein